MFWKEQLKILSLSWTRMDKVKSTIKELQEKNQQVPQPAITCSKLTRETLEQGVKYVQS